MFRDFLTTEGERLLAKSIAGTATITFTKMEIGDGDRGTSTKAITSLESPKLTLDIYSVLISGDNNIEITTMLDSEAIRDGFYFREKGIYATDGTTEILFMYGTSGSLAEWIENVDSSVFTRTIRTIVTLSESDNVQITIQKGAYASGQDAENILAAIQNIEMDGDWAKYSQAESILSLLDTFVAAYTAARAGKLDNLDALISSRAPANTALSNATWTNARAAAIDTINANTARLTAARAGLIDNLDAKISSRAPASTALSNGVWTDTRASYLDYLVNASFGLPAINNRMRRGMTLSKFYSKTVRYTEVGERSVFSVNGSGVIEEIVAISFSNNENPNVSGLKVIVDNVEILNMRYDMPGDVYRGIARSDVYDHDSAIVAQVSNGVFTNAERGIVSIPEPLRFESNLNILVYHSAVTSRNYTDVSYVVLMD